MNRGNKALMRRRKPKVSHPGPRLVHFLGLRLATILEIVCNAIDYRVQDREIPSPASGIFRSTGTCRTIDIAIVPVPVSAAIAGTIGIAIIPVAVTTTIGTAIAIAVAIVAISVSAAIAGTIGIAIVAVAVAAAVGTAISIAIAVVALAIATAIAGTIGIAVVPAAITATVGTAISVAVAIIAFARCSPTCCWRSGPAPTGRSTACSRRICAT